MKKWRANLRPQEDGELSHAERQRAERWEQQQLHRGIYQRAIRRFDSTPAVLTTSKEGERDGKKYHEETKREILAPAALLRTAQRAVENLSKESDKPPPPSVRDPEEGSYEAYYQMMNNLLKLRREAEQAGRVPRSRSHQGDGFNDIALVEFWVAALLGQEDANLPWNVHLKEGDSLQALLDFYRTQWSRREREGEELVAAELGRRQKTRASPLTAIPRITRMWTKHHKCNQSRKLRRRRRGEFP